MITQETIDDVIIKLQLPASIDDRKIAAMDILLEAADYFDLKPSEHKPRLDINEARLIVDTIYSQMNRVIVAVERTEDLLDELKTAKNNLRAAYDQTAKIVEKNRHLAKFVSDTIATGAIGVR